MRRRAPTSSPRPNCSTTWGVDRDVDPNAVEVYVGYLRRKIDAPFGRHACRRCGAPATGWWVRRDRPHPLTAVAVVLTAVALAFGGWGAGAVDRAHPARPASPPPPRTRSTPSPPGCPAAGVPADQLEVAIGTGAARRRVGAGASKRERRRGVVGLRTSTVDPLMIFDGNTHGSGT